MSWGGNCWDWTDGVKAKVKVEVEVKVKVKAKTGVFNKVCQVLQGRLLSLRPKAEDEAACPGQFL